MPLKRGKQDPFDGFDDVLPIGKGAFAQVYRATDTYTGQSVALKVLDVVASTRLDTATFELEARALGAVNSHPNVVTLHRAIVHPDTAPVLVLDLCQGSLADRLAREGPLPVEQVVAIGVKLAGALETAHRAGILHRDLKPQNVLITRYDEPALADFGVAALREAATSGGSPLSGMTLLHAAPEVILGHPATPASDVYGLVSTLYELLGGHAPHFITADEDPAVVQRRVLTAPPPVLRAPGVTSRLADLISRALAKTPEERPLTAVELAQQLRLVEHENGWPLTPCRIAGEPDLPVPDAPLPPPTAAPSRAAITTSIPNLGLGARPLSTPTPTGDDGRDLEPLGPRETVLLPSRGAAASVPRETEVAARDANDANDETVRRRPDSGESPKTPEDDSEAAAHPRRENDSEVAAHPAEGETGDEAPAQGVEPFEHPADRLVEAPSGLFPRFGATPQAEPAAATSPSPPPFVPPGSPVSPPPPSTPPAVTPSPPPSTPPPSVPSVGTPPPPVSPPPPPVLPAAPLAPVPPASPDPPQPDPDLTEPLWGFEERRGLHETIGLASSAGGKRSATSEPDEAEGGRRRGKRKAKRHKDKS